jgi:hypothetical protein
MVALLFIVLCILDVGLTVQGLKAGATEANPLPARLFKILPPLAVMIVLTFAAVWVFMWALSTPDNLWKWLFLALLIGAKLFVVLHNLRVVRSQND